MKKLFTIDDFIIAFISALVYGLSFEIPMLLGWGIWTALPLCLIIGGAVDMVTRKLVFNKAVQKNAMNKALIFFALFVIFLIGGYVALQLTGLSLKDYFVENYIYSILPSVLGFVFSMAFRWYQIRKIRVRYGDGSQGFLYDDMYTSEEIEEFNKQNRQIKGEYDTKLAVKTKTGVYVGYKEKKGVVYREIPYAKPPVGKLRWKAPESLPASDEVFEAKYFGASAIQVEHKGSILKIHRQSEDCLTLNVCVGKKDNNDKKPVVVLFHHGDFSYGGSADPLMYLEKIADTYSGFIGVSFNYRLGIFGFIDFSEVPGGENYPDALNLGLLDQIAALEWVKENISAFGGDPGNITVMGFESGAISISLLAVCERAKGLFQKAFIFFGSPDFSYLTPDAARAFAQKLLEETGAKSMDELQRLTSAQLKDLNQKIGLHRIAPTCDGKLIPANVFDAYKNGAADGIEFIVGIPSNEGHVLKSFIGEENFEEFVSENNEETLSSYLDADTAAAVRKYIENRAKHTTALEAEGKFYEQWNTLSMYLSAMQLAAGGNKVHLMYWDVKPLIENLGSGTVDVVLALFGDSKISQMYGNVIDSAISEILQHFLKKFISGETMSLYNNEIKGVKDIDWKEFPSALIVSNKIFKCAPIEDRLYEIDGLWEFMKRNGATFARE
ncbi:carboxylesterase family protein [Selenomonas sp. AB3002]|uniref:carboxylesterase family protein n=1 Tax=Selenomonas sp. AB3002 TaxID=1392502 RepID=UPI00068F57CD